MPKSICSSEAEVQSLVILSRPPALYLLKKVISGLDIRQHLREQQSWGQQFGRIGYILGCVTQSANASQFAKLLTHLLTTLRQDLC
jgi:hypothetical protein